MAKQGARRDLHGDWPERQVRAATVKAHIEAYGMNCPGFNRAPHPSLDLTADHPVPVAVGGEAKGQAYTVLCRACNSSRGKSPARELAQVPVVRSRPWL